MPIKRTTRQPRKCGSCGRRANAATKIKSSKRVTKAVKITAPKVKKAQKYTFPKGLK